MRHNEDLILQIPRSGPIFRDRYSAMDYLLKEEGLSILEEPGTLLDLSPSIVNDLDAEWNLHVFRGAMNSSSAALAWQCLEDMDIADRILRILNNNKKSGFYIIEDQPVVRGYQSVMLARVALMQNNFAFAHKLIEEARSYDGDEIISRIQVDGKGGVATAGDWIEPGWAEKLFHSLEDELYKETSNDRSLVPLDYKNGTSRGYDGNLNDRMKNGIAREDFEECAKIRDKIQEIEKIIDMESPTEFLAYVARRLMVEYVPEGITPLINDGKDVLYMDMVDRDGNVVMQVKEYPNGGREFNVAKQYVQKIFSLIVDRDYVDRFGRDRFMGQYHSGFRNQISVGNDS